MRSRALAVLLALPLLALALAGCADSGTKQVSNTADAFRYTGDWKSKVGTETFTWTNTRGAAEINVPASSDAEGSVTIRIRDASGASVYEGLDGGAGIPRERTLAGPPGAWTVDLVFEAFKGHVDVSARAVAPAAGG